MNIFYGKEREFSKKKILLLNYFPSELFDDELEEKEVLKILGKYLLLGEENYEKEDVNIEREL